MNSLKNMKVLRDKNDEVPNKGFGQINTTVNNNFVIGKVD